MKRTYRWDEKQHKLVEIDRQIPDGKIYIIPDIKPYMDDQMDHEPIYVKSRRHRVQLLKERGLAIL